MTRPTSTVGLFAATLFTSAALLFLVQPMVGKMLLPLFGGTPAVWITCLVFYQTALLAGYLYAHIVCGRLGARWQAGVHLLLLSACLLFVPIDVGRNAPPGAESSPLPALLLRLAFGVGLPFLALSGTGTLLQAWFARSNDIRARDPYFLYAASNLGSVLALVSYPFLLEPRIGLERQGTLWAAGFGFLILLTLAAARASLSKKAPPEPRPLHVTAAQVSSHERGNWILLAFIPSSLMMGVTLFLTTDIAPMPLVWIVPLALYLLAFTLAFAFIQELVRLLAWAAVPASLALVYIVFSEISFPIWTEIALHLSAVFLLTVAYLGRLAASRPPAVHLTEFYLLVSLGGALAGVFNAMLAPALFRSLVEYRLVLALATALLPMVLPVARASVHSLWRKAVAFEPALAGAGALLIAWTAGLADWRMVSALAASTALLVLRRSALFAFTVLAFAALTWYRNERGVDLVYQDRSFFSVLRVRDDARWDCRTLQSGTTSHGEQSLKEASRREPQAFYYPASPIGQMFTELQKKGPLREVAIVGLGTGALSAYGAPGDRFTFFEIDPAVARVARDTNLFTYVRDSRADVAVVLGDARLTLREQPPGRFRALVVDAFSSDAIPVHLLTREAVALYVDKLAPDGVIAVHISNRYLNLDGIVGRAAAEVKLAARLQRWSGNGACGGASADWVILSRDAKYFGELDRSVAWEKIEVKEGANLWTDDFSNLLSVVNFRKPI